MCCISNAFALIKNLLKDSILPLVVIIIAIIGFFFTPYLHSQNQLIDLLKNIFVALIPAAIFYWFTVTLPNFQKKEIAKKSVIALYQKTKESMLMQWILALNKKQHDPNIELALTNYDIARKIITQNDIYEVMNQHNQTFIRESLYHLQQLNDSLSYLLFFEFIQLNKKVKKRVENLRYWIKQFEGSITIWSSGNNYNDYELEKTCFRFICEFLLGCRDNKNFPQDDFVTLLQSA